MQLIAGGIKLCLPSYHDGTLIMMATAFCMVAKGNLQALWKLVLDCSTDRSVVQVVVVVEMFGSVRLLSVQDR